MIGLKKKVLLLLCAAVLLTGIAEVALRSVYFQRTAKYPTAISYAFKIIKDRVSTPKTESASLEQAEELEFYVSDHSQFETLFPEFRNSRMAFSNTRYHELVSEETKSLFFDEDGNLKNKPNHKYETAFLRSRMFKNWDPVVMVRNDLHTPMTKKARDFVSKYALDRKTITTDELGNRTTLPKSDAHDIVLIIGDSVAFGVQLSDSETLASQLQSKHPEYKFVNASVGGADAVRNITRLRQQLSFYGERVKSVIYVHCENDFSDIATPEYIVSELSDVLNENGIESRTIVYQTYIYRSMPDLLRNKKQEDLNNSYKLKSQTLKLAQKSNFEVVDFYNVVNEYRSKMGTPYAGFSLYVDHCHFSALGTKLVADRILNLATPG